MYLLETQTYESLVERVTSEVEEFVQQHDPAVVVLYLTPETKNFEDLYLNLLLISHRMMDLKLKKLLCMKYYHLSIQFSFNIWTKIHTCWPPSNARHVNFVNVFAIISTALVLVHSVVATTVFLSLWISGHVKSWRITSRALSSRHSLSLWSVLITYFIMNEIINNLYI